MKKGFGRMATKIISAAAFLLIAGCASVGITELKSVSPRGEDCQIDVYAAAEDVKVPWEAVCMIDSGTATHIFADKTASGAIKNAKPYACKCGADALIIESMHIESQTLLTSPQGKAILKAIRYKAS
jgi:hypothetical protein